MGHICTEESFLINASKIKSKCFICLHISYLRIGWVGEKCDICDSCIDPFDICISDIVKLRREKMGLSRKEMSKLTGYSKSTIKRYEYVHCSENYYKLTGRLIKKHFKNLIKNSIF